MAGFYLVSVYGYIIPIPYSSYESAMENCDMHEMVFWADSLEDLENSLHLNENLNEDVE